MMQVLSVKKKSLAKNQDLSMQQENLGSVKGQDSAMMFANNIKITNASGKIIESVEQQNRKPISWLLMILNIIAVLASCFQNGYFIYAPTEHLDEIGYVFLAIMLFDAIVCFYTSCYLTDKWEMLQMYLLLDNIVLVCIAASIGFISFTNFRSTGQWYYDLVAFAFPIDFFILIGNFRCLMIKGQWSKWRIISYKFALLICCIMFFQIGVYFISVDYSYTNGADTTFDSQVKQLMLLNVFGTFSLIIEIYSKMTDLDHTGELQSTYQLKQFNDTEMANNLIQFSQLLKIRQEAERKGLLEHQK